MESLPERIARLLPPAPFAYEVSVHPLAMNAAWQAVFIDATFNVAEGATVISRKQAMSCNDLSDTQLQSWIQHHLDSIVHELKKITKDLPWQNP